MFTYKNTNNRHVQNNWYLSTQIKYLKQTTQLNEKTTSVEYYKIDTNIKTSHPE